MWCHACRFAVSDLFSIGVTGVGHYLEVINPPMFSGSDEFAQFETVYSKDGDGVGHTYSENQWNTMVCTDPYNSVGFDGTITSVSDGGVGGFSRCQRGP